MTAPIDVSHARSAPRRLRNLGLAAIALCGGLAAGPALAQCYPATAAEPLEPELIIQGTGGTYWDAFKRVITDPFEKECGVKVTLQVSPARSLADLRAHIRRGGADWDIGSVNTPWDFEIGMREKLFEPLPAGFWDPIKDTLIPGSHNEAGVWQNPYASVLIYNTKAFQKAPSGWADFWDTKTFPGPRSLQDSPINILIALVADGVTPDKLYPIDDQKLKRAFTKLDELRPSIRTFWTAGDQPVQGVHRGDFAMATAYNGRAFAGLKNKYDMGVQWHNNVLSTVWAYRPRGTKHPRAAAALLAYLNRKDRQAAHIEATGYSSAIKSPESLTDPQTAAALATSSEHLATRIDLDPAWWSANITRVQAAWKEWVTTGKVNLN
jgi:putative spermidine/putrescine transport system substrate-binding protein